LLSYIIRDWILIYPLVVKIIFVKFNGCSHCIGGGIIGIFLGIISSYIIEIATGIETILSISSITLSFFVATAIGLIFGIAPAKSAANKRPIEAIRYD
jgi:ABC-type antimicrobial peptide transport system permease subunit